MDGPLLVLGFFQVVALLIYLWVGRVFISQPVTNHPGIFYDPTARLILCNGPAATMVILVVLAFMLTNSPWLFLGLSLAGWIVCSPRPGCNDIRIPQQNLYDVIELPQDAGQGLIEERCIRLGERYRSDKNPGDLSAALMFAQIERAYQMLGDPAKRAAYDAELRSEATAQGRAASVGTVRASANSASALTGVSSGDISLHSKINSWVALLLLLSVFKVLSDVLSRIAASWIQANNFEGMTVATVGAMAGVAASFVITVIFGRFLAKFIPLWAPLSGILRTRGAAEITQGKRMLATAAMLFLTPVVLVAGGLVVQKLNPHVSHTVSLDPFGPQSQPVLPEGSFVVQGLGARECGEYLEYRQKEYNNYEGATARANAEWALGYITGYDSAKSGKQQNIPVTTVIAYLDKFCRDQPLSHVVNAVLCLHGNYGGPTNPQCK